MRLATTLFNTQRHIWLGKGENWLDLTESAGLHTVRSALEYLNKTATNFEDRDFIYTSVKGQWSAPVDDATRILCAGLNFSEHAKESEREVTGKPTFFTRWPSSLTGHEQPIFASRLSDTLDWEGEAAVIVGKTGHRLTPLQAQACIAGFTCFGDHSIREYQRHATQATAGKNFDAIGAIGPWIVLRDSLPDLNNCKVVTRVDGVQMQSAPLNTLIHSAADLLAYASEFMALIPGDVIALGTPKGVGARMTPPRYLKPGEVVEVEVSGIGILRNTVVADQ
jgi:2-keto-4-pentenoate hydratase/2-oxohepta-3-ene-1,7-dioic acid hydratase in catechol pathway